MLSETPFLPLGRKKLNINWLTVNCIFSQLAFSSQNNGNHSDVDSNMLHIRYDLPRGFSCLNPCLRSNSVKSCGVKISIVLGMEEEMDHKRLKGWTEQSQARDQLFRLPFSYGIYRKVEKNYRITLVLYFPFSAYLHLPIRKHLCGCINST